ncbi:MAG TPA: GspH/FimT family pseudopilin [Gemmatimonadaceae bacterium]|nr:GspH/FimT family pseudopilin [Gemmatimonadaceae bacterium]
MSRPTHGFTIIEVTIVIAVASVLFAILLPRAWSFVDRIEVRGAVTEIESMFSLARHVAIARGRQATLDIEVANRSLSIRAGPDLVERREVGAAHGVSMSSNRSSITYSPIGVGYGASNFSLIVTRNRAADTIVVSRLGRVRH